MAIERWRLTISLNGNGTIVRWTKTNSDDLRGAFCTRWPQRIRRNQPKRKWMTWAHSSVFCPETIHVHFVPKIWPLSKFQCLSHRDSQWIRFPKRVLVFLYNCHWRPRFLFPVLKMSLSNCRRKTNSHNGCAGYITKSMLSWVNRYSIAAKWTRGGEMAGVMAPVIDWVS